MSDGRIFISYRRGLDQGTTGRLYDRLERHYESDRLFMDVDDIPLGRDFVDYLHEQVAACEVFVAVIGPGWVGERERLMDEEDFVRIEIEAALQRPHIPIIPVFIDGAGFPGRDDLPKSLHALRRRNGLNLRHDSFAADVDKRLLGGLKKILPPKSALPLKVRLYGSFSLERADGVQLKLGTKQNALLAMLADAEEDGISRYEIEKRLWSESPPERAKNSLSDQLSRLRKKLDSIHPDIIRITNEKVYLNPKYVLSVGTKDDGDFLQGLRPLKAQAFLDWVSQRRGE